MAWLGFRLLGFVGNNPAARRNRLTNTSLPVNRFVRGGEGYIRGLRKIGGATGTAVGGYCSQKGLVEEFVILRPLVQGKEVVIVRPLVQGVRKRGGAAYVRGAASSGIAASFCSSETLGQFWDSMVSYKLI